MQKLGNVHIMQSWDENTHNGFNKKNIPISFCQCFAFGQQRWRGGKDTTLMNAHITSEGSKVTEDFCLEQRRWAILFALSGNRRGMWKETKQLVDAPVDASHIKLSYLPHSDGSHATTHNQRWLRSA
jgi:hypothetical protein